MSHIHSRKYYTWFETYNTGYGPSKRKDPGWGLGGLQMQILQFLRTCYFWHIYMYCQIRKAYLSFSLMKLYLGLIAWLIESLTTLLSSNCSSLSWTFPKVRVIVLASKPESSNHMVDLSGLTTATGKLIVALLKSRMTLCNVIFSVSMFIFLAIP